MHPRFASSATTSPLSLATNTRPPRTAGCDRAELTPANPYAHFSFRRGTVGRGEAGLRGRLEARVRDARAPPVPSRVERRGLERRRLRGAVADDRRRRRACRPGVRTRNAGDGAALGVGQLRSLPEHVADGQRREDRFRCDGASTSRVGARESGAGCAWHDAHAFWNTAAPSGGVCACSGSGQDKTAGSE